MRSIIFVIFRSATFGFSSVEWLSGISPPTETEIMMRSWTHGSLRYRLRKIRVVLLILALGGLFLLLHSQLSSEQRIEQEGVFPVEASSRQEEETLAPRSIATDAVVVASLPSQDARSGPKYHQPSILPSIKPLSNIVSEAVSTRETTKRRNKPWCAKMPQQKSRFREVDKEMLVYSVWFDDRKTQNFIRVLLLSTGNPAPSLTCHFESASTQKVLTSEASFYEHNESYRKRFRNYIASCVIPQELDNIPCFVKISTPNTEKQNHSSSVVFPVGFIDRQHDTDKTGQYGICIPPVHGKISVDGVIEFVELQKILGASQFTFYDLAMPDDLRKVLSYYERKGLVRVLPWNLPSYIEKQDIHYFGQPLSITDCMYRSMSHLFFVAFNDLDEFIVPLQHNNISAMLKYIHKDEHCGHCFESVTFDISNVMQNNSRLLTQSVFSRTSEASRLWTKCIVDPRRIFEQGIHHISKQIEEYYHTDKVNWDIARVFHYRKCHDSNAAMQPGCSGLEVDKTLQKYGEQLLHNFETTRKAVAES